jgi:hypothetical protein
VDGHAGLFGFLFDQADVIVSTRGCRGPVLTGWQLHKACTTHAAIGGVTNA